MTLYDSLDSAQFCTISFAWYLSVDYPLEKCIMILGYLITEYRLRGKRGYMFSAYAQLVDGSWIIEASGAGLPEDFRFSPVPEELLEEFLDEGSFYVAIGAVPADLFDAVVAAISDAKDRL